MCQGDQKGHLSLNVTYDYSLFDMRWAVASNRAPYNDFSGFGRGDGSMVICLDEECQGQNRDKARFCASCGLPTRGALLHGRYEIQSLLKKDRSTVTLGALDRHVGQPVIVRALQPRHTSKEERETFLQDAELAMMLSNSVHEPGSIRVIDFGQDGPVAFLVKSEMKELDANEQESQSARPRMTVRVGGDIFQPDMQTQRIP